MADKAFDIAFVGHLCFDEIVPFEGEKVVAPGSAVLCGAMAAARTGKRILVATRLRKEDAWMLDPMKDAGAETAYTASDETSYMEVIHPSANVDERRMYLRRNAGYFKADDMPASIRKARRIHLAGISDQEFNLEFIKGLKGMKPEGLSADMQSFVRQAQPGTREVLFKDSPIKKEVAALLDMVKLDAMEAAVLTGSEDVEAAARQIESWGCPEIVITRSDGVFARAEGKTIFEKFSNRSAVGRTGRGDTTFAGYLSWRLEHGIQESLKFAAALVSIKMETQGPFSGTLEDVLKRMKECHGG